MISCTLRALKVEEVSAWLPVIRLLLGTTVKLRPVVSQLEGAKKGVLFAPNRSSEQGPQSRIKGI